MRKIEIICYDQQSQSVEFTFKKFKIPFHVELTMAENERLLRYTGICPDLLADSLTNELNKIIDTRRKELYVTSLSIEATLSDYLSNYAKELETKQLKVKKKKLIEEYESLIEPNVKFNKNLLFMIVIAAGVAVAGLFANNASLVIGAMLISPLLGPISAFSFNTAVGKTDKMLKALVSGSILLVSVIATGAILTGITVQFVDLPLTDEILSRTIVSPVFLAVAIALGLAGGIAMSTNIPGILVGVAIAAALVPPAAVAGIGIALWDFEIFSSALTLTAANIIGLVLGMMVVFFIGGVTPRKFYEKEKAQQHMVITISIFIGLSIFLGFLSLKP
ncbi:MAG: TIGR00341 family protein [Nitrosopumilus sp.]|uniref:TIGR00341 family protein n=1 Tax=Nitrosopumilus sp. TaxID=2024843 RepID=UPI002471BAC2|nr:TIGR00341 family protein [Nitrosopumilus sp.]MDH5430440.1 TIGR00341 family protein [Nitrosopumilus sp.]MDH5665580.1 TIGR00341 family protein [Nitrosopumilus sp.]MDH5697170.1 TIGR00341 family protein [Nitrosopumilus sp.]